VVDEPKVLEPHTPHMTTPPHVIVRGEGVRVWDKDGVEFIDGVSGLWCANLGYGEKRLIDAAVEQFGRLPYYGSFNHRTNDVALALTEDLATLAPMAGCRVFLANSGSEANDSAVKFAWYYHASRGESERTVILSHERGYHGSTALAASVTGMPHMHDGFVPLPFELSQRLACPDPRGALARDLSAAEFEERLLAEAEKVISRIGGHRVAAVLAEPILGAGGLVIPPGGYLRKLKSLLEQYGILLILDEVITAFGRTGRMFGAEYFDVVPDMLTCAKGLSSAYLPISAVLVSEQVCVELDRQSRRLGTLGHGFTYSGHPVCAAVARESLRIVVERDLPGQVRNLLGPELAARVAELETAPGVSGVRSLGMLAAVDLRPEGEVGAAGRAAAVRAQDEGLLVRAIKDTLILAPPLTSTCEDLAAMTKRLDAALAGTAARGACPR
jgi:4-aminobutyrate---pyruvate transaminase